MEAVVALRRVRRLLMFGGLAVVAVSWAILIWSAAGALRSVVGWVALLAYPVAGAGYLAAFAIIGSPGVRYRWLWVAVVYGCSFSVMAASFAILIAALDAKARDGTGQRYEARFVDRVTTCVAGELFVRRREAHGV